MMRATSTAETVKAAVFAGPFIIIMIFFDTVI